MRLAGINRRLALVDERGVVDVVTVSAGRFSSEHSAVYQQWAQFTAWPSANRETIAAAAAVPYHEDELGPPVPEPGHVFGIGMNYRAHAAEAGLAAPDSDPVVFAKFLSSITGPAAVVELPSEAVDYEAELAVVIRGPTPQFSLNFSVPQLIESLSAIVPLLPGDLIFTGTPAGIGWTRDPRVAGRPGDRLVTQAEVIGEMTTTFTAA